MPSGDSPQGRLVDTFSIFLPLSYIICRPSTYFKLSWIIIILGSVVSHIVDLPDNFFSSSKNFLNVYFVKLGWGWTLSVVSATCYSAGYLYTGCRSRVLVRQPFRMLVGTAIWFGCTEFILSVERATGRCSDTRFTSWKTCASNASSWWRYEISGHVFLLTYSVLVIAEEIQPIQYWHLLYRILPYKSKLRGFTSKEIHNIRQKFRVMNVLVFILTCSTVCLLILWLVMLTSTALFFHTLDHKILGGCMASACWWVTYRVWYRSAWPGRPSDGLVYNAVVREFHLLTAQKYYRDQLDTSDCTM